MNDHELIHLAEIKARLESPSWSANGREAGLAQDMRWLIAVIESQTREIEQLKSSVALHTTDLLRRA